MWGDDDIIIRPKFDFDITLPIWKDGPSLWKDLGFEDKDK